MPVNAQYPIKTLFHEASKGQWIDAATDSTGNTVTANRICSEIERKLIALTSRNTLCIRHPLVIWHAGIVEVEPLAQLPDAAIVKRAIQNTVKQLGLQL